MHRKLANRNSQPHSRPMPLSDINDLARCCACVGNRGQRHHASRGGCGVEGRD